MSTLMRERGSRLATRAEVEAVVVPAHTRSYRPVPYRQAIGFIHEQIHKIHTGPDVTIKEQYTLNANGQQLFALATVGFGGEQQSESPLAIGLRQSYNKTLPLGVAVGQQVIVCDNLCFSGDAFKVVRKNTTNVWSDFAELVTRQVEGAFDVWCGMKADVERLMATPCHQDRGYALLGGLVGAELLTPTQVTVAFGDWRTPRHTEFAPRTMWSLYNCVTEALKRGSAGGTLRRHAGAHDWFVGRLS